MCRLCGATLGLFAFSVTIFLSLAAGNSIEETLWRAVTALFVFCGFGLIVGWMAGRVIDEYALARHRALLEEGKGPEPDAQSGSAEEEVADLPRVTS